MKYHGTIKGKEKQLANLRKFLTQNKDEIFVYRFNVYFSHLTELYSIPNRAWSETTCKISEYLKEIFKNEDELIDNFYLLIPDDPDLLTNVFFPDDSFKYELLDSSEVAIDQILFDLTRFSWFGDFFEELLTELIEYKMNDKNIDKRVKLIRNYVFNNDKNKVVLRSKGEVDLIKNILENNNSDELEPALMDGLLIDFYHSLSGEYFENERKYKLISDGNKVELKDLNFSLTKQNGFKELNFVLDVSTIGLIKFDLNSSPMYSAKSKEIQRKIQTD